MDIEDLRKVSEESRLRAEQRAREASAREAEEKAAKARQELADLPKRIAEIEVEVQRSLQVAANQGERECVLSSEQHLGLWQRGFLRTKLRFHPSWREQVIIDFCSRKGLSVHFTYYGKPDGWGQNDTETGGDVFITASW